LGKKTRIYESKTDGGRTIGRERRVSKRGLRGLFVLAKYQDIGIAIIKRIIVVISANLHLAMKKPGRNLNSSIIPRFYIFF